MTRGQGPQPPHDVPVVLHEHQVPDLGGGVQAPAGPGGQSPHLLAAREGVSLAPDPRVLSLPRGPLLLPPLPAHLPRGHQPTDLSGPRRTELRQPFWACGGSKLLVIARPFATRDESFLPSRRDDAGQSISTISR